MKKLFFTVLKILVFFIGWAVLSGVIDIPSDNPAIWRFFAELIPFAVLLLFTVIFWLIDKKTVKIPICDNIGKGTLTGAIIGFVWIGAATAILFLSKQILVTGKKQIPLLWLWIISAFINVVMQELLIRGYIYQLLKEKYNLLTAIIFTTILFTALHGGAFEAGIIPVLNVISMCLFTSALYESEKTLLAPIMAHAIWNILGAIIIGGVNLADDYPHMLTLSASQNKLLSGGDYKIEASIVVTFLNIALMMMFYARYRKQKTKNNK